MRCPEGLLAQANIRSELFFDGFIDPKTKKDPKKVLSLAPPATLSTS